jgi:hypothetical protein
MAEIEIAAETETKLAEPEGCATIKRRDQFQKMNKLIIFLSFVLALLIDAVKPPTESFLTSLAHYLPGLFVLSMAVGIIAEFYFVWEQTREERQAKEKIK